MKNIDLPAFYLGVREELEKVSFDVGAMPVNENILPNISNQAKWKYVRTKDGLKLSDGNLVYGFTGFPHELPAEDARVSRLSDDNILNFENDAVSKGTAQIHRSSPDNIYVTLANGSHNPTFMLQHEDGKNWRYSPSKKFVAKLKAVKDKIKPVEDNENNSNASQQDSTLIDIDSLMKGAEDFIKEAYDINQGLIGGSTELNKLIEKFIENTKRVGNASIDFGANHPILSALGGYGAMKGISKIRDKIDPRRALIRQYSPSAKMTNELGAVASGVLPAMLAGAIRA